MASILISGGIASNYRFAATFPHFVGRSQGNKNSKHRISLKFERFRIFTPFARLEFK